MWSKDLFNWLGLRGFWPGLSELKFSATSFQTRFFKLRILGSWLLHSTTSFLSRIRATRHSCWLSVRGLERSGRSSCWPFCMPLPTVGLSRVTHMLVNLETRAATSQALPPLDLLAIHWVRLIPRHKKLPVKDVWECLWILISTVLLNIKLW